MEELNYKITTYKDSVVSIVSKIVQDIKRDIDDNLPGNRKYTNNEIDLSLQYSARMEMSAPIANTLAIWDAIEKIRKGDVILRTKEILEDDISSVNAFVYLLTMTEIFTDEEIEKYSIEFHNSVPYWWKEAFYISQERCEEYKKKISELEKELGKSKKTNTSVRTSKFSKTNITNQSVKSARVEIITGNLNDPEYRQEYSNINELLTEEGISLEPTIKNGIEGLPAILNSKLELLPKNAEYAYIRIGEYKIKFFFEE